MDTSLNATSVAVLDGDKVLAARSQPMARGHQEHLAGLVRETMRHAGIGFTALDRIGVTVGPGSFTGLRVGLAFAKGLSIALSVPCLGVGTLHALAASVQAAGIVVAAIDARRDQLYLQVFEDGAPLSEPEVVTLSEARARLDRFRSPLTLVGSCAAILMQSVNATLDHQLFPDPVALARLTLQASPPILRPEPLYLRAPDAKTIAERAAAIP